jgi:shikimate dehydrogenase
VNHWVNKDTEIYCSFAENAGNTGCQMMNTAFHYHRLNKIYKSFSVDSIEAAVAAVRTLNIKGFAITMPYKVDVLKSVDEMSNDVKQIGAANTVMNRDGILSAYNTDAYAAKTYLDRYDNRKTLYIVGNFVFEWKMPIRSISIESITRPNRHLPLKHKVTYYSQSFSIVISI